MRKLTEQTSDCPLSIRWNVRYGGSVVPLHLIPISSTSNSSTPISSTYVFTNFVKTYFLIQIVNFFCLEMYKIANTVEKLRKNAQEFILITLLKLITVDETGIDE